MKEYRMENNHKHVFVPKVKLKIENDFHESRLQGFVTFIA